MFHLIGTQIELSQLTFIEDAISNIEEKLSSPPIYVTITTVHIYYRNIQKSISES